MLSRQVEGRWKATHPRTAPSRYMYVSVARCTLLLPCVSGRLNLHAHLRF